MIFFKIMINFQSFILKESKEHDKIIFAWLENEQNIYYNLTNSIFKL